MRLNDFAVGRPTWGLRPLALLPLVLGSLIALAPAQFAVPRTEGEPISSIDFGVAPALFSMAGRLVSSTAEPTLLDQHEEEGQRGDVRVAVDLSIDWLLTHQADDGGWHNGEQKRLGVKPIEPYFNDIAVTGLALQALIHSVEVEAEISEAKRESILRGVEFLMGEQTDEGCYGAAAGWVFLVGHPAATEAIANALSLNDDELPNSRLRASLTQAVQFINASRNPYAGWRYDSPPIGDNDSLQTGRMMLALVAAFDAGVEASPETFAGGYSVLTSNVDKDTGRTNYQDGNQFALRIFDRKDDFPAKLAEAPTAVHVVLRMKEPRIDVKAVHQMQGILLNRVPVWSRALGTTDFDYWMHGTRAMSAVGGLAAQSWNQALLEAILPHQLKTGEDTGAWEAADAWSAPGMEAYATATNTLSLLRLLE